ncbi:uncharacterized, partial [Tachysurus ichikawai]
AAAPPAKGALDALAAAPPAKGALDALDPVHLLHQPSKTCAALVMQRQTPETCANAAESGLELLDSFQLRAFLLSPFRSSLHASSSALPQTKDGISGEGCTDLACRGI